MLTIALLGAVCGLLLPSPGEAEEYRSTGLMLKTAWPLDELENTHEQGWGISAVTRSLVTGSRTWFHGQASYMNFRGKEVELPAATERLDSAEIFGISLGIMAGLTDRLFIGAEGGYYFGDEHSWGVVPFVSIIHKNFELRGEYKVLGIAKWWGISLGYYLF